MDLRARARQIAGYTPFWTTFGPLLSTSRQNHEITGSRWTGILGDFSPHRSITAQDPQIWGTPKTMISGIPGSQIPDRSTRSTRSRFSSRIETLEPPKMGHFGTPFWTPLLPPRSKTPSDPHITVQDPSKRGPQIYPRNGPKGVLPIGRYISHFGPFLVHFWPKTDKKPEILMPVSRCQNSV